MLTCQFFSAATTYRTREHLWKLQIQGRLQSNEMRPAARRQRLECADVDRSGNAAVE